MTGKLKKDIGPKSDLLFVYGSWADELRSKYKRISKLFRHGPSIGRSRELYLSEILSRCLPSHLDACHGAFYSSEVGASSEQDIIVVARTQPSAIEEIENFGVYLRESVRACIEVKTKLTKKELQNGLRTLAKTRNYGPEYAKYALFAYETRMSPKRILDSIDNTIEFFDNRPDIIVVLGKFVIVVDNLKPKKPCPQFDMVVFGLKIGSPDLTLMELVDTVVRFQEQHPYQRSVEEIRSYFEKLAERTFVCPETREGKGLGTNLY